MTSPGARYSAGTAFLDIVPSFDGVQKAISRKAREMEAALGKEAGDQFGKSFGESATKAVDKTLGTTAAEKQGGEAGKKYAGAFASELKKGLASAQREVTATLKLTTDDDEMQESLREIEATIKRLNKAKIGIDMDAADALKEVTKIKTAFFVLQENAKIDVSSNFGESYLALEAFEKRLKKLNDVQPEVKVKFDEKNLGLFERKVRERLKAAMESIPNAAFNADVSPAMSKLQTLRASMASLSDKRIGVDIGGREALSEMAVIGAALEAMRNDQELDLRVRTDAAAAAAELTKIAGLVELVDGKKAKVKVDLEEKNFSSKLKKIREQLLGADADGQTAADGFRAFNAMVLAGAAILPAAAPAIAGVAAALALIGPLALGAAAGLAVMGIGFSGIGDAVGAIGKVNENGPKEAEARAKRITAASRTVEDAQRSVARAEQSGAQQIASAQRAVSDARANAARVAEDASERVADAVDAQKDAEKDLATAQKAVQRAQEDLTQARAEAREELEDLQLAVRGGALAERDAVLDLKEAREALEAGRAEGTSGDDLDRLILKYDQAVFRLDEVRERNGDLTAEQAEWARTGVEGSERVQAAQEGVVTAQDGVLAAQQRVADAAREVTRAQVDGERARADAAVAISDAIMAQRDAEVSASQSIQDAQRNLIQAQQDYTLAVNETSASQQALEVAMGKLGPAGQQFAYFWAGLLPQFREMRDIVQAGMFPGLQDAITSILTVNGPQLQAFLGAMGQTLGDVFRRFGEVMTSPQWQSIWATFTEYAPIFFRQFAEVGMNILTFFGELFGALAPSSERFGDALVRMTGAWADWAAGLKDSETFQEVMNWVFEKGPGIFDSIWGIVKGAAALFVSLMPLGLVILDMLGGIGNWLASLDPNLLGAIVTLVLGLVIAFQLAVGAISVVAGALTIAAVPFAAIIFAVVGVIGALVALYLYSETFRNGVNAVFRAVGDTFVWIWDNLLWPVIDAFSKAAQWLWKEVLVPVFDGIMVGWDLLVAGMQWAWENILKPVWDILMGTAKVMLAVITIGVLGPILLAWELMSMGIQYAYEHWISPTIDFFKRQWDEFYKFIEPGIKLLGFVWDLILLGMQKTYENVIYPYIVKPFMDVFTDLWRYIETAVNGIGEAWGWLKDKMEIPINWVIKFVLNEGLFDAYNWIVEKLGLESAKIDHFNLIGSGRTSFAAGGYVPGYSPTPTADNIPAMLTAGEYVQPVNTVNYYGADFMDAIRKRKIPREALQYYATGGLVSLGRRFQQMGATVSRHSAFDGRTPTGGHGKNSLHYDDRAIDVNTRPGTSALEQRELTPMAQLARSLGFRVIFMSPDHYNHLHVDDGGGSSIGNFFGAIGGGIKNAVGAGVGWVADQAGKVWNAVTDVFGSLKDSIVGPVGDFFEKFGDSQAGKIITALPGKAVDVVWDFAKGMIGDFFTLGTDSPDNSDIIPREQRSGPVQDIVRMAAARYGWNQGKEWTDLYALINKESSWNPNAQNPTSTAYGLFQFLNGTWKNTSVSKTSDPELQAIAGLEYISGRYGSPSKAWAFHRSNNWYSEGGEVGKDGGSAPANASTSSAAPTLYDAGGWLPPGITTVLNATTAPEPILTGQQWEALTSGRSGDDGYDGARGIRDLHLHEVNADLSEAIDKVNHTVRVLQRGGRY